MTEENVTYVELKLCKSKNQKNKRNPGQKRTDFPWHIIAVILGILCLFLLLATAGLGYWYFQNRGNCKSGNDSERNDTSSTEDQNHSGLLTNSEKKCEIQYDHWSCCEKTCYYFSNETNTWDESKKKCQQLGYNLVKIDDEEEQNLIQSKIQNSYWVGLQKNGATNPWLWHDGSSPSWRLNFQKTTSTTDATCGRVMKTSIINHVCDSRFPYICEKKLA